MKHVLLPQDDISERIPIPPRDSDLSFEGHITTTGPYRYRFEGIVHTLSHTKMIESSIKNPEFQGA